MTSKKDSPQPNHTSQAVSDKEHKLREVVISQKIISPAQLEKALSHKKRPGNYNLLDTLVRLGYLDHKQKMNLLKEQVNITSAVSRHFATADGKVVALIPETMARRHTCIALEKNGTELTVAMTDPLDLRLNDYLRDHTGMTIKPVLGGEQEIKSSIDCLYSNIKAHKKAADLITGLSDSILSRGASDAVMSAPTAGVEAEVAKLVNVIIGNAVRDQASDIHIEPMERIVIVRYRVNRELNRVLSPPKATHGAIINRIKVMSGLNLEERKIPQEGRAKVKIQNMDIDIRVSLVPTVFGEKAVLSILQKETFENSIAMLGFSESDVNLFLKYLAVPFGMVLVCGPSGCGKTTTLYAALQEMASDSKNTVTIEDPIESQIEGINQIQLNPAMGFTMASALHAIQRQDPDTILISEIKDEESADLSIKMALTGHMVLTSMLADNTVSAIGRLMDIGIPPLLLGSALNLIVSQRLVKKICPKCRTPYSPPDELLATLTITKNPGLKFFQGEGCVECSGTGFLGSIAIFELLTITGNIRKLIFKKAPSEEIVKQASGSGLKSLTQSAVEMAIRGLTT
ncbi:GspE/PulE family protein, partial [Fibrobacterota bacterium]